MRWADWKNNVRRSPRQAFEASLTFAVIGFVIVAIGGIGINAGYHPRESTSTSPAPVAGTIVAMAGLIVVLFGVFLAIANVALWISAKRRRRGDPE